MWTRLMASARRKNGCRPNRQDERILGIPRRADFDVDDLFTSHDEGDSEIAQEALLLLFEERPYRSGCCDPDTHIRCARTPPRCVLIAARFARSAPRTSPCTRPHETILHEHIEGTLLLPLGIRKLRPEADENRSTRSRGTTRRSLTGCLTRDTLPTVGVTFTVSARRLHDTRRQRTLVHLQKCAFRR